MSAPVTDAGAETSYATTPPRPPVRPDPAPARARSLLSPRRVVSGVLGLGVLLLLLGLVPGVDPGLSGPAQTTLVVFAAAVGVNDTGFALTAAQVHADAQAGERSNTAVSTMTCD